MSNYKDDNQHLGTELIRTTNSKEKYSNTELDSVLLEYFTENPGIKITCLGLEKATGISRFVWSRRMATGIEKLNNRPQDNPTYAGPLEITNIAQTVNRLIREKKSKELDRYLRSANVALQNCVNKALGYDDLEEQVRRLKKENEDKDKTIATLKEAIEIANKTHFSSAIKSRYKVTKNSKTDFIDIQRNPEKNAAKEFDRSQPVELVP